MAVIGPAGVICWCVMLKVFRYWDSFSGIIGSLQVNFSSPREDVAKLMGSWPDRRTSSIIDNLRTQAYITRTTTHLT
jgi:hypothetical protein